MATHMLAFYMGAIAAQQVMADQLSGKIDAVDVSRTMIKLDRESREGVEAAEDQL